VEKLAPPAVEEEEEEEKEMSQSDAENSDPNTKPATLCNNSKTVTSTVSQKNAKFGRPPRKQSKDAVQRLLDGITAASDKAIKATEARTDRLLSNLDRLVKLYAHDLGVEEEEL
jgi:hypothetical protein